MRKNKALTESAAKILFSLIPYGGQLLSEVFFDYRSRIKQDRLNNFMESLLQYLQSNGNGNIPLELQHSEDFGDLFESVIKRVVQTSSSQRILRFRNIVGEYIANPVYIEYRDTYLDLIEKLNGSQIRILKAHSQITENVHSLLKQRDGLKEEMLRLHDKLDSERILHDQGKENDYYEYSDTILRMGHQLDRMEGDIKKDGDIRKAEYYGLDEGDYLFLVQDLYSKGLLIDIGLGAIDLKAFDTMEITTFAKRFLVFISEDQSDQTELDNSVSG